MKTYNIGGVERTTITYANHILPFVEHVGIFAQKGIYDHTNIINENVALHFSFGKISNLLTFVINFYKIIRIIKKNKINIVHYHQRIFILYIFLIKLFNRNIKIVYTHHNVFNDNLNKLIYADALIAVSVSAKNDLLNYHKDCIVIKHGIKCETTYSPNKQIETLGFVGRFHPSKGIMILLMAFNSVIKLRDNLKLFLVGEGVEKKRIEEYINENNLDEKIFILPPQPDIHKVFSNLDLLVVPSEKLEGFGVVIIEAMSLGVTVIASDLPAFTEIIKNDETGLLFNNVDYRDLESQIIKILSSPKLKEHLIINAQNMVKEKFELNKSINQYIKKLFLL